MANYKVWSIDKPHIVHSVTDLMSCRGLLPDEDKVMVDGKPLKIFQLEHDAKFNSDSKKELEKLERDSKITQQAEKAIAKADEMADVDITDILTETTPKKRSSKKDK